MYFAKGTKEKTDASKVTANEIGDRSDNEMEEKNISVHTDLSDLKSNTDDSDIILENSLHNEITQIHINNS